MTIYQLFQAHFVRSSNHIEIESSKEKKTHLTAEAMIQFEKHIDEKHC